MTKKHSTTLIVVGLLILALSLISYFGFAFPRQNISNHNASYFANITEDGPKGAQAIFNEYSQKYSGYESENFFVIPARIESLKFKDLDTQNLESCGVETAVNGKKQKATIVLTLHTIFGIQTQQVTKECHT